MIQFQNVSIKFCSYVIYDFAFISVLFKQGKCDSDVLSELLGVFAKLRKETVSFIMSICPHGTTRAPLDGFS
jgi:hypothetical protein